MPAYFLDSSALVKRYIRETGTAWILNLFRPASGNQIFVAEITLAEVIAALTRRHRGAHLTPAAYHRSVTRFRRAFADKLFPVSITLPLIERASHLAETCFLRGYDAVQLAAASEVHAARTLASASPLVFCCADNELLNAALAEGLQAENPNLYP
jgi:predicted nucleic acid-binding protein